jgi:hypothetical protein
MKKQSAKKVAKKSTKPKGPATGGAHADRLYSLEVFIIEGLLTEAFVKRNPEISRVIKIRGDQTLADLHDAIFDAFDRDDEHLYEFQFGKGPRDFDGPRYRRQMPDGIFDFDEEVAGVAEKTTIDSLKLKVDDAFGYWFDFGDDWLHQINVTAIDDSIPKGKYPKVISRVGASPPQYPDMDEE